MSSILEDTKHQLGLLPADTTYDTTVIIHINAALAFLQQLNVGPDLGYEITDANNDWSEFLYNDPVLNAVKSYVYLKVKLAFDPPKSGFETQSMDRQLDEMVFRILVAADVG